MAILKDRLDLTKSFSICHNQIYNMREEDQQQSQQRYYHLLTYVKQLLKRSNLCNNTYLYKKMSQKLTVPLHIITEEKNVSAITRNYREVIDALEDSGLARVLNGKEVKIIEYPTVKINVKSHEGLRLLEEILQQKQKRVEISKRVESEQYINLTVFSENIAWLEDIIKGLDTSIQFQRVSLLEDIRLGVDRIRKLKFQHAKAKTQTGRVRYSLTNPPKVFVRHALEDSDDEQDEQNGNKVEAKPNGTNGRHKEYRRINNRAKKIQISDGDFPELK